MPTVDAPDYDKPIVVVWSSFGHRFMGTGEYTGVNDRDPYVNCLTCGGEWIERNLGDGRGEYVSRSGDEPTHCTYRSDLSHGVEAVCEDDNGSACESNVATGRCPHTEFDCNCLFCTG